MLPLTRMIFPFQKAQVLALSRFLCYLLFFVSLIFSFRGLSSISIALLILLGLVAGTGWVGTFSVNKGRILFLAGCVGFFLLQVLALFYTKDLSHGWQDVRLKSGIVAIPLAAWSTLPAEERNRNRLLNLYCLLLVPASLFCLVVSGWRAIEEGDSSFLFYHNLVKPIRQHAVYFSVLVTIGILYLCERILKKDFLYDRRFHLALTIYLVCFLLLLSSKLVIAFLIGYGVILFFRSWNAQDSRHARLLTGAIVTLVVFGSYFAMKSPASSRFREIWHSNLSVVTKDQFKPGDYFDGLQFRLLQWRFVYEILSENHRWWMGVSPGDAQSFLNQKYLSKNMYAGDPARGDRGYLAYNTHNQFLESTLENGFIGLLILLFILYGMWRMVRTDGKTAAVAVFFLLCCWFFTEAPLETQYGLVIVGFFPLFLSGGLPHEKGEHE